MLRIQVFIIALLAITSVYAQDVVIVKVILLSEAAIFPERTAPATVVGLNNPSVATQIAAQITEIPARVGDVVEKGTILVKLDCENYVLARRESNAGLNELSARIDLAKRKLERTKKLTLNKSVTEEILDERESDLAILRSAYQAAHARLDQAKLNESRCVIRSPFRAVVSERINAVGQYAKVGDPVIKLTDIDTLEISAQIPGQDTELITRAQEIFFSGTDKRYHVKLRTVVPTFNTETRNREVRLEFDGDSALPGQSGKLEWRDSRPHIPGNLIVKRAGKLGVFTVQNKMAKFIPVPNAQAGRASPVELPESTLLVSEGHYALQDGDPVTAEK